MKPRNSLLACIALLCFSTSLHAQFIKRYHRSAGENVHLSSLVPVSSSPASDIYAAGTYGTWIFIGEMTQGGNFVWSRKINVAMTTCIISGMIKDSDGNLVLCGTDVEAVGNSYVLKFNPATKTLIWYRKTTSNSYFTTIVEKQAGGNYLVGGQESVGSGAGSDNILMEVDRATGNMTVVSNTNINSNENIDGLIVTPDSSNIYYSGRYELDPGGEGDFRVCLTKLDAAGNLKWTRAYIKNSTSSARMYTDDLLQDGDSLLISMGGDDNGINPNRYCFIEKCDLNGNIGWAKRYDATTSSSDGRFAEIVKYPGGYILAGSTVSSDVGPYTNIFLMNIDLSGNIIWAKTYPFRKSLYSSGISSNGLCIIGSNIYYVGEKAEADGSIRGIYMATSISTGDVGTCDNDLPFAVTQYVSPYQGSVTVDNLTVSMAYTSSAPAVKNHNLTYATICSAPSLTGDGSDTKENINSESGMSIYPNPGNGTYTLKMDCFSGDEKIITVLNAMNQRITEFSTDENIISVDISKAPSGLYFILISDKDTGEIRTLKFLKE